MEAGFSWKEDREWLLTNGLGGYAYSTITGLNTRKYHGLLVAGFSPEDRRVLLSKVDEELIIEGDSYKLSTSQFRDVVEPRGCKYQTGFSARPHPHFAYSVPGALVEKTIYMPRGENAVVVEYKVEPTHKRPLKFCANFIVTSRDHHWVLQNPHWDFDSKFSNSLAVLTPRHERPPVTCIGASSGTLRQPGGDARFRGLFYRKELERGYTPTDDLFIGARLELAVRKPITFFAVCAADFSEKRAADLCKKLLSVPSAYADHENLRKEALVKSFSKSTGLKVTRGMRELVESSDDFIVSRAGRTAVIAGYPFFGEWGRDSLISLPGLCLATGRKREAEDILLSLMSESQKGIVPNSFASGKSFNSIDATLWMFWAVWKYLEYTGDYGFIEDRIWPGLKKMMRHYVPMVGQDALIRSESTAPATWMDAVVDGTPVTPRNGSPVEIQALWYNALMVCSKLVERFGEDVVPYLNMAEACKKSFNSRFVNKESGYLYDVVDGERRDASVRPNALFAISLDFPVLDRKCWKQVVDTAKRELLTPYGLRTLSRQDPNYKGFASGNQSERDRAYHQGDAWPWLLGAFADAYLKVYPDGRIGDFIRPLLEGRNSACAGKVPEIYDGSEPQKPAGCISQAWSCAELIRLLSEHSDRV